MTERALQALFIISLPRAGSTLLQRIMTAHPEIESVSETWFFMPFFRPFRSNEQYADFDFKTYRRALTDFCSMLPEGETSYRREVAATAMRMYELSSRHRPAYFLDKTPRYALILPELLDAMPEAKFILLWRNPLAIAASMIESFSGGRWNLHSYRADLYEGLDLMCRTYEKHPERFEVLRYEDLIEDPQPHTNALFEKLDLSTLDTATSSFASVKLHGSMGDKTGSAAYSSISRAPLSKWKTTFGNPLRKRWALSYLEWLGNARIEMMGYDMDSLREDIESIPVSGAHIASDTGRMLYGRLEPFLNLNILRQRMRSLASSAHPNLLR